MRYLSDEWIEALDVAARGHTGLRAAARDADLVLQQTVTGVDAPGDAHPPNDDDGSVTYRIELHAGEARVRHGRVLDPTVSLTTDLGTAVAIARGTASAQVAFMEGRLRLGGNMTALLEHQEILNDLDDVFRDVRDRTEWHA